MTDFAAFWRTNEACLTHAEWREVVMEHKRIFSFALDRVDHLSIATGTQGCRNNCLCLATGKQGRTVSARQETNFNIDRTHRAVVATIDS